MVEVTNTINYFGEDFIVEKQKDILQNKRNQINAYEKHVVNYETIDNKTDYKEDSIARLFNVVAGACFALFFILGFLVIRFIGYYGALATCTFGFVFGLLFIGIGRIISLLNDIKYK